MAAIGLFLGCWFSRKTGSALQITCCTHAIFVQKVSRPKSHVKLYGSLRCGLSECSVLFTALPWMQEWGKRKLLQIWAAPNPPPQCDSKSNMHVLPLFIILRPLTTDSRDDTQCKLIGHTHSSGDGTCTRPAQPKRSAHTPQSAGRQMKDRVCMQPPAETRSVVCPDKHCGACKHCLLKQTRSANANCSRCLHVVDRRRQSYMQCLCRCRKQRMHLQRTNTHQHKRTHIHMHAAIDTYMGTNGRMSASHWMSTK